MTKTQVDAFLDTAAWRLAAMKSDGRAGIARSGGRRHA